MKKSLSSRILGYIKSNGGWICSGEIERLSLEAGYKSSNSGRRCREMVTGKLSNGRTCPVVLERKEVNGVVWYRAIQEKVVIREFPVMRQLQLI